MGLMDFVFRVREMAHFVIRINVADINDINPVVLSINVGLDT